MIKNYSQIRCCQNIPVNIIEKTMELCSKWDLKYGYTGKNYSENPQYQLQLLINANEGENLGLYLIQHPVYREIINDILAKAGYAGRLYGDYEHNGTEADHDVFDSDTPNPDQKGWTDLKSTEHNIEDLIWLSDKTVLITDPEIKNTVSYSERTPSNVHRTSLALAIVQDTFIVECWIPNSFVREARFDSTYKKVGEFKLPEAAIAQLNFVRINKDWSVSDFNLK